MDLILSIKQVKSIYLSLINFIKLLKQNHSFNFFLNKK